MKHFVPLFVVPTDLTERTEAYGVIFLESTKRIDATRHTTESTEMIAHYASTPHLSPHFCGFMPREA